MFAIDGGTMAAAIPILYATRRATPKAQVACDVHWRACENRHPSIVVFGGGTHACIEYDWYTLPRDDCESERLNLFVERLSAEVAPLMDTHGPALRRARAIATRGRVWGEFASIPLALVEPFLCAITGSVAAALDAFPCRDVNTLAKGGATYGDRAMNGTEPLLGENSS